MENQKAMDVMVKEYILEHVNLTGLESDVDIFEEGLVNSLFAIELMTFIEKAFKVKITMDDLDMENFKSVNNIVAFIKTKKAEG